MEWVVMNDDCCDIDCIITFSVLWNNPNILKPFCNYVLCVYAHTCLKNGFNSMCMMCPESHEMHMRLQCIIIIHRGNIVVPIQADLHVSLPETNIPCSESNCKMSVQHMTGSQPYEHSTLHLEGTF